MKLLDWKNRLYGLAFLLITGPIMLLVGLYWLVVEPVLDLLLWIESKNKKYPDGYLNWW